MCCELLKVYEEAELEALLEQNSCQTQEEQYDGQYFDLLICAPDS